MYIFNYNLTFLQIQMLLHVFCPDRIPKAQFKNEISLDTPATLQL